MCCLLVVCEERSRAMALPADMKESFSLPNSGSRGISQGGGAGDQLFNPKLWLNRVTQTLLTLSGSAPRFVKSGREVKAALSKELKQKGWIKNCWVSLSVLAGSSPEWSQELQQPWKSGCGSCRWEVSQEQFGKASVWILIPVHHAICLPCSSPELLWCCQNSFDVHTAPKNKIHFKY